MKQLPSANKLAHPIDKPSAALVAALLGWPLHGLAGGFTDNLVAAAIERTHHTVVYDCAYVSIDYPNGDVAPNRGVCAAHQAG